MRKILIIFFLTIILGILGLAKDSLAAIFIDENFESGTPHECWPCKYGDPPESRFCWSNETYNGWKGLGYWWDPQLVPAGLVISKYHSAPNSFYQIRPSGFFDSCGINREWNPPYPTKIYNRFYVWFTSNWNCIGDSACRNPSYPNYTDFVHWFFYNSMISSTGIRINILARHPSSSQNWWNADCGSRFAFWIPESGSHTWEINCPDTKFNILDHLEEWISVEFMFDSTNGPPLKYNVWINGVKQYNVDQEEMHGWQSIMADYHLVAISGYNSLNHNWQGDFYIDDFVISDSYIGPMETVPDTTPPVISNGSPTGTLPAGTTQTTMSVTTNENATCRYSSTAGTAYSSMTNTFSTTGGTSHSTTLTGLTNGTTYNRYVRCQDTASNANTSDYTITFSVASGAATFYVDGTMPDNTGNGTSWATAKKNIANGVALLTSGDTLKIKSGTYNESLYIANKNWSSETTIETDDGNGNPGIVTLTGSVSAPLGSAVVHTWNSKNITIDGRQTDGFNIATNIANTNYGIYVGAGADGSYNNIKVKYCKVGTTLSTSGGDDRCGIFGFGISNIEIAYCNVNLTSGAQYLIEVQSASGATGRDPNLSRGGSIHHCDLQGNSSTGYSAISVKYLDGLNIYSNYIHNVSAASPGMTVISHRECHDHRVYNNVITADSGKSIFEFWQARGNSTEAGSYANRNWFFNNTLVANGGAVTAVTMVTEGSSYNKIFNNLYIGNSPTWVVAWTTAGRYNEIYNNVITGTNSGWFESTAVQNMFTVQTGGTTSQGTAFINLSGNRPYPYWDLSASKDGVAVSGLTTDYNGDVRSSPPDVGAFEYEGGGDTTPPAAPTGVTIQ